MGLARQIHAKIKPVVIVEVHGEKKKKKSKPVLVYRVQCHGKSKPALADKAQIHMHT